MRTKPKGILFDLDDTIISFDGGAESLWEAICEEFAPTLEPSSQNLLRAVRQARIGTGRILNGIRLVV